MGYADRWEARPEVRVPGPSMSDWENRAREAAALIDALRPLCIGVVANALDGGLMRSADEESIELVRLLGITRQECRDYIGYPEDQDDMLGCSGVEWADDPT